MIRHLFLALGLLAALAAPARAQLGSVPHVFAADTTILSADANENFSTAYANACNRTGCIMTGLLTSQQLTPASTNTYDVGTSGVRFRDLWLSRDATIGGNLVLVGSLSDSDSAVTIADQLVLTSTTAPQVQLRYDASNYLEFSIASNGAVTLNANGAGQSVTLTDPLIVTGVVSATSFSGSGASLAGIPETGITDGTLLARLAADESVTGQWTFTGVTQTLSSVNPVLLFNETDAAADNKIWRHIVNGTGYNLQISNDAGNVVSNVLTVARTGTAVGVVSLFGTQLAVNDGTAGIPIFSFQADPDTGIFRVGANNLGISLGGTKVLDLSTSAGSPSIVPGTDATAGVGTILGSSTARFLKLFMSSGLNATDGLNFYESLGSQGKIQYGSGHFVFTTSTGTMILTSNGEISLSGDPGGIIFGEATSASLGTTLSVGTNTRLYMKGDKIIFQFNDAGTMRWKSLDLTGTGVTWVAATSEP